jgi:hypothetical protein
MRKLLGAPRVFVVAGAIAAVLIVAVAGIEATRSASSGCAGEFRWDVKTLSDPAAAHINYSPRDTTIAKLVASTPPSPLAGDTPRGTGVESTAWRVTAALDHMDRQADGDVHLVIADPADKTKMMLAEFPDVRCPGPDHSFKKQQLRAARVALIHACGTIPPASVKERLGGRLRLTGIGFFDSNTQFNPNGVELHPVLVLKKLTCKRLGTYR